MAKETWLVGVPGSRGKHPALLLPLSVLIKYQGERVEVGKSIGRVGIVVSYLDMRLVKRQEEGNLAVRNMRL